MFYEKRKVNLNDTYDPNTKTFFNDEGKEISKWTFENVSLAKADWFGNYNSFVFGNPWHYPTKETAETVFKWVDEEVAPMAFLKMDASRHALVSHPLWEVVAERADGSEERFSLGLIARHIIVNGWEYAKRSLRAEMKSNSVFGVNG